MPDIEDLHEHERFNDHMLEQCPICGVQLGGDPSYDGRVYDADGNRYENIHETDPSDGPYYCADCYEVEYQQANHKSLYDYEN